MLADTLQDPVQVLIGREVLAKMRMTYDGLAGCWEITPADELMAATAPGLPLWMVVGGAWLGGLSLGLAIGSYFERRRSR